MTDTDENQEAKTPHDSSASELSGLAIPRDLAKRVLEYLHDYQDEGPIGEGWKSDQPCWCNPTPDDDEPLVFLHHAMDSRELYEQGNLLPA